MAKTEKKENRDVSREERVTGKRPAEDLVGAKDSRESKVKGDK